MNVAITPIICHGAAKSSRYQAKEHLMIKSSIINNFRTFKYLKLDGFSRINIIVGDNGAGKTALMEALFLGIGSTTSIPMQFKAWRSQEWLLGAPQDGIFEDLFYDFDKKQTILLNTKGTGDDSRSLRIYYDPKFPKTVPLVESAAQNVSLPIIFEWKYKKGKPIKVGPIVQLIGQSANISFPTGLPRQFDPTFLAARATFNGTENADRFDKLSKMGKAEIFTKAVTEHLFKGSIASLSIGSEYGRSILRVKPANVSRAISPSLVSDGLAKIITILLCIAHSEKTATFVDEIENGLHFSRHKLLWEQMLNFCKVFETQLFATTHSLECLDAVLPAIEANPNAFSLIHVYQDDGIGKATVTSGKDAVKLIQSGLELRT